VIRGGLFAGSLAIEIDRAWLLCPISYLGIVGLKVTRVVSEPEFFG
jgi:hypothetical protein